MRYPAVRKTNQHVRLATEGAWSEPTDGPKPLSSRIDRYMHYIKAKDLVYSYLMEHENAFDILLDVVGDKACRDVSVDDMNDVVAAIGSLPVHWSKKPEYRELSVTEAVAKASRLDSAKRMLISQQRTVTILRTFLHLAGDPGRSAFRTCARCAPVPPGPRLWRPAGLVRPGRTWCLA